MGFLVDRNFEFPYVFNEFFGKLIQNPFGVNYHGILKVFYFCENRILKKFFIYDVENGLHLDYNFSDSLFGMQNEKFFFLLRESVFSSLQVLQETFLVFLSVSIGNKNVYMNFLDLVIRQPNHLFWISIRLNDYSQTAFFHRDWYKCQFLVGGNDIKIEKVREFRELSIDFDVIKENEILDEFGMHILTHSVLLDALIILIVFLEAILLRNVKSF